MKTTRLLVIDDDQNLTESMKEYFDKTSNIAVTLKANNGREGIELINNRMDDFDFIILDLVMPNIDGLSVLKYIYENKVSKKVVVIASFMTQDMMRQVTQLGASYFMLKPFDMASLEEKINNIMYNLSNITGGYDYFYNSLQLSITKTLHDLGLPSHRKGYQYIREGITLVYKNPELANGITKELYPKIAERYSVTVSSVERAIRTAIEVGCYRGDWELMEQIFGHSIDIDKAKPTNSEFIVTIADKLRLEFSKVPISN